MPSTGPPTILFEVFWTQQKRKRLVEQALEGTGLPPEDYPFYVTIGADGPLTPTALAAELEMPLSTVTFRVRRLERRAHAERVPNPEDGRSFLIRLTREGQALLDVARPRFRDYAEAVEARLGPTRTGALAAELRELREAIDEELSGRSGVPNAGSGLSVAQRLPGDERPADDRHRGKSRKRRLRERDGEEGE